MIEELKDRYDDVQTGVRGYVMRDEPDGKNAGIGHVENLLAFAVAAGAGLVAREALQGSWRAALDREPPKNPASHQVDWKDALLWGALSGAIVGVARIASRRATSSAYNRLRN